MGFVVSKKDYEELKEEVKKANEKLDLLLKSFKEKDDRDIKRAEEEERIQKEINEYLTPAGN